MAVSISKIYDFSEESRTELLDLLHNNYVHLKFTKKDGSERVMRATLMAEKILWTNTSGIKKAPTTTDKQVVWDADENAFRAFNWSNLIAYEV